MDGFYDISDPTGVRSKPFNSPGSKQPYARFLSEALQEMTQSSDYGNLNYIMLKGEDLR